MPTISQSKDIIYLLTHTADWAAGRQFLLHYKALITSLSFPFRTILVGIPVRNVVRSLQRALKTKCCVSTWAWTAAAVFGCLTPAETAAEHRHVSGALNRSYQLGMEKEENCFSLIPWVSYIRPSGVMELSGEARRLRHCSFFSWTAEGGEDNQLSSLLWLLMWEQGRVWPGGFRHYF